MEEHDREAGNGDQNEKYLINDAKSGNIDAYEKLIEAYQKKVFNIALRMLGNYDGASEAAQEVFIKIFKSLNSFRQDSAFSTWVFSITRNICLDLIRKNSREKVVSLDEAITAPAMRSGHGDGDEGLERQIPDLSGNVEETAEKNEARRLLTQAIGRLSPEHRLVVVMRDMQGFSYAEIAKAAGCGEGTVKSRISRARLELRELLKDHRDLFRSG